MNAELFNDQLWWYVARSGGIIALALAAASVLWGLLLSTRYLEAAARPKWLLDLHRFLGGLTVIFTLIHMAALMLDSFVSFSIADVLVPFASSWQPGAVAWGVVAFWLLIAVQGSSMLMNRMPRKVWKWIHMSSYALLWAGAVHGIVAGTDASNPVFLAFVGGGTGLITFLAAFRVLNPRGRKGRGQPAVAS
ncbi:MAG: putative ferric reductase [Candidatus Poriferisodalaceae bacterium]|jgi:predicted ferric reductase